MSFHFLTRKTLLVNFHLDLFFFFQLNFWLVKKSKLHGGKLWCQTKQNKQNKKTTKYSIGIQEYFVLGSFNLSLAFESGLFYPYVLIEVLPCSLVLSLNSMAALPSAFLIASNSSAEKVPETSVSCSSPQRHASCLVPWLFCSHSFSCFVWPHWLTAKDIFPPQQKLVRGTTLLSTVLGFVLFCSLGRRTLTFILELICIALFTNQNQTSLPF